MNRDLLELSSSLAFVDEVYEQYLTNRSEVDPAWADVIASLPANAADTVRTINGTPKANGTNGTYKNGHANGQNGFSKSSLESPNGYVPGHVNGKGIGQADEEAYDIVEIPAAITSIGAAVFASPTPGIWPLVNAYRVRGHFDASLDPLGLVETAPLLELKPETWGLTDGNTQVSQTGIYGMPSGTVAQIHAHLKEIYSGSVGIEFMHIASPAKRSWIAQRMETGKPVPSAEVRKTMLHYLIQAEGFERFCHVKYPGTKRFSLEGAESVIPMLDLVLSHGTRLGAIESVIGMAHRGRLTTLEVIMKRAARDIFCEFDDVEPTAAIGGGDVKYHLGYSSDRAQGDGVGMHVSLAFNPSHLEAVDPVVLGRVRAKQIRHGDVEHRQVLGVLLHGDAAFAGQGLVAECLNLTSLAGYRTGGTVHIIVNNQVGFTASPAEARSTPYCTDIAKMIDVPIWHVNGEDLDAVARVVERAMEYRAQFGSDVIIDMYCYRKYGHNENDEPGFTQPVMYDRIQKKESVVETYGRRLVEENVLTADDVAQQIAARLSHLESELAAAKASTKRPRPAAMAGMWRGYIGGQLSEPPTVDTTVPKALLTQISDSITAIPDDFTPHAKIVRLLEQRAQMGRGEKVLDWGMAELLAYGSLLWKGTNVRLSGQDCGRGTFSHRHAIITDFKTGAEHLTLGRLQPDQGECRIYDSPLSEAGVLGFEFGYSLDYPDALVMWEAQFGDFANGAQVIIDQFITSSEDKWNRLSGLVLLLPHGYEGQGAEHSSARLERFLESCAEQNIQVAQPTTPAQIFHLLRMQVLQSWRKPLIVMTPKSLLRLPAAASTLDELANGTFQRIIPDAMGSDPKAAAAVDRVLFCSGKIYYELVEQRAKRKDTKTAIVRIESLYPWWPTLVEEAVAPYTKLKDVMWVQDEPTNMGAAVFVQPRITEALAKRKLAVTVVSRPESASPATGSHKAHALEQEQIFAAAFGR